MMVLQTCLRNVGPSLWEHSHTGCYARRKEHGNLHGAQESQRQTWVDHPGGLRLAIADPLGHHQTPPQSSSKIIQSSTKL